ncbi:MAG: rhodanese-like domain-containing protein [Rhodobiaceae bacterium]|nr:rhodanese-like domain-containing protein [Rhodobiaceae bacterium]
MSRAFGAEPSIITPKEAFDRVKSGDIVLVDIRTQDEWRQSGIAQGAHPISMRDRTFLADLDTLTGGDKAAKIGLICATGGRSAWLRGRLEAAGYSNVIDVGQGMFGNPSGPGWIRGGLPVERYAK